MFPYSWLDENKNVNVQLDQTQPFAVKEHHTMNLAVLCRKQFEVLLSGQSIEVLVPEILIIRNCILPFKH